MSYAIEKMIQKIYKKPALQPWLIDLKQSYNLTKRICPYRFQNIFILKLFRRMAQNIFSISKTFKKAVLPTCSLLSKLTLQHFCTILKFWQQNQTCVFMIHTVSIHFMTHFLLIWKLENISDAFNKNSSNCLKNISITHSKLYKKRVVKFV